MKTGIFGGTFNPVHNGHISLCRQCAEHCGFDRVLLIPTNLPPHKAAQHLASNEDRLEMLRLAIQGCRGMEVSDVEYRLGGRSYTVETLARLKKMYPEDEFSLIMGSDMLRSFPNWYRAEDILAMATLTAGARFPEEYEQLLEVRDSFGAMASRIEVVKIQVFEISSTRVREICAGGEDASSYLPAGVWDYIRKKDLYGFKREKERNIRQ